MSETAIKTLIRCKLEMTHAMFAFLPEALQEPLRSREKEILEALQETVKEFLEKPENSQDYKASAKKKEIKSIDIE